jgi:hypothetical protein
MNAARTSTKYNLFFIGMLLCHEGLKVSPIEERMINGHKFCYRLTVYKILRDKYTGLPKYTNHLETLLYYDEDGDDKFETLEEGLDSFSRGHIPKWVLEK